MAEFYYEALDKGGKNVKGVIDAPNEEAIIEKLRGMGYYPLNVKINKKKAGEIDLFALPGIRLIAHRITNKHVMTFTRQLSTLIDAGLPILRSLHILEEQVESVLFKEAIRKMATDIESGSSLSDSMSKHPKVFDKLYVNMVRAGEIGGVLESILNKIAAFLEKKQALRGKVRSAMMYPLAVSILAAIIVSFILWKIVPAFEDIFTKLGGDLPLPTRILVVASEILLRRTWIIVVAVVAIIVIYNQINKRPSGKLLFDRIKLKMPVFGELLRKIAIARWASTLSTMITSGVPILQSLDIVRETSGNEVISRAMIDVYQSIKDGDTIHEPLGRCDVFPPLVVHMVAVGEETGAIDQMLTKVAEAYEREVDDTVNALTSIIEPVLIVCLGVLIGAIVIALYLPLFEIPNLIK